MKKTWLIIAAVAALLFTADDSFAQKRGYVALTGGLTSSELRGGGVNSNFRSGGTLGLQAGWRAGRNTIMAVEASWVQMGGKFSNGDQTRLDYIQVPLTFGGALPLGNSDWVARLYTGLGLGFKVGCSSDSFLNCSQTNSPIFSWPIGLAFAKWPSDAGKPMFGFDVRYDVGLGNAFSNVFVHNYSWQFRLLIGKRLF